MNDVFQKNKLRFGDRKYNLTNQEFANKLGLEYVETSSKKGENVEAAFTKLVRKIYEQMYVKYKLGN